MAWFLVIAINVVKLFLHTIKERAVDQSDLVVLGRILMDSLSTVGARPRLELFFVKSFCCSELKNFSSASLQFYFMAWFLH